MDHSLLIIIAPPYLCIPNGKRKYPEVQIVNDPFAAVRIPEYRNLMIGRFTFVMAMRMITTVVSWWIYEITGDELAIGMIGLAEVIPALTLALYSGHRVDIKDKRRLILQGVTGYLLAGITLLHYPPNKHRISYIYGILPGLYMAFFSLQVSYVLLWDHHSVLC